MKLLYALLALVLVPICIVVLLPAVLFMVVASIFWDIPEPEYHHRPGCL